jgi:hypothetical protein
MTQQGTQAAGYVYNWHELTDVVTTQASANNLADGTFVYQDGTNGITTVPISSIPEAGRIRFLPVGVDNSGGSTGDYDVETVKTGAIVVCTCDGAITVGDRVVASGTTAGRCAARAATSANLEEVIGTYLGHTGELEGTGNDPSNAADGELIVVQLI